MKKYAFRFSVQQTFEEPILKHSFLLRCMPGTFPFQRSYAHKLTISGWRAAAGGAVGKGQGAVRPVPAEP